MHASDFRIVENLVYKWQYAIKVVGTSETCTPAILELQKI
jgi:hypothetical protein